MFTDIVDSVKLKRSMQGETDGRRDNAYRVAIKEPHDKRIVDKIRQAAGHKVESTGDGFLFTFSDVDEAVLCAIGIQRSLHAEPILTPLGNLQLRIGIHTGSANPMDSAYTASTIDKAARVQAAAAPGEVLVSEETHAMVKGLRGVTFEVIEPCELKGFGNVTLYRAIARDPSAQDTAARLPLSELENPYDFIATANQRTFKGRMPEAEDLLDSIQTGTHTAIFGLQRMGKTSLIEQGLETELQHHPEIKRSVLFATIDMQRLGGAQVTYRDFAHAIFEAVITRLVDMGLGREVQNLRNVTRELFEVNQYQRGDRTEFFSVFARLIGGMAALSHRRIILMIDEFSEIRKVIERNRIVLQKNPHRASNLLPHDMYIDVPFMHHLSSLLKDEAVKRQLTFIVLVRPFLAEYDEREELQLLKLMKPITLGYLDAAASKELITEPLDGYLSFEGGAVEYLITLTAGHPYLLQFILKLMVDKIKRTGRPVFALADVKWVEERMVSDGPAFDAQFAVLISDYSVDEVTHPKEAQLGKGLVALVSKYAQGTDGWVASSQIFEAFSRYKIPEEKTASLLSQLTRTCILDESCADDQLRYRVSIPLLQERFIRQNLFLKYFRYV
jgi:class 3 adenylate cyclase